MKRYWLINIRKQNGLTQLQVASMCFIDRGYYAQIESGARQPSISVAKKISVVLNFNPSAFFMEELEDPFLTSLKESPIVIAQCNLQLRYTWIFNPHPDFKVMDVIGKTDIEIAQNAGTRKLMKLKHEVISTGKVVREFVEFPLSDGGKIYDVFGKPLKENNTIIGAISVSTELTYLFK